MIDAGGKEYCSKIGNQPGRSEIRRKGGSKIGSRLLTNCTTRAIIPFRDEQPSEKRLKQENNTEDQYAAPPRDEILTDARRRTGAGPDTDAGGSAGPATGKGIGAAFTPQHHEGRAPVHGQDGTGNTPGL